MHTRRGLLHSICKLSRWQAGEVGTRSSSAMSPLNRATVDRGSRVLDEDAEHWRTENGARMCNFRRVMEMLEQRAESKCFPSHSNCHQVLNLNSLSHTSTSSQTFSSTPRSNSPAS